MIEIVIGFAVFLFIQNRLRAAQLQRKKERFAREVLKTVEQKKKLDELYGRDNSR